MSAATVMQPLLLEIQTEELPIAGLAELAQSLTDGLVQALQANAITLDEDAAVHTWYTPRRLAVFVPSVAVTQSDQHKELFGPYVNIALDDEGQPTRALQGFASKAGIDWQQLERITDDRGERFALRSVVPGQPTVDVLPELVSGVVNDVHLRKAMRWGDEAYEFVRPVNGVMLWLGDQAVDVTLFGVASGTTTQGHRFMHDGDVAVSGASSYADTLKAAHVVVDPTERAVMIRTHINDAASSVGGTARIDDDLLAEVVGLTEWPCAMLCAFDEAFLRVPDEALISAMEGHQKFFPILNAEGKLMPNFVGIANIASTAPDKVKAGYERVIRPRFADAMFFFDEDLKQGLASMNDELESRTYQQSLGTLGDKVRRVAKLAERIAPALGVSADEAKHAAELSKADLQSRMVNEFPEMQGIAGRRYAETANEPEAVALALEEAYWPRFSADRIAASSLGKTLAVAERMDTLAGGFAAGLAPSGNKDPFALRRNALGMVRTLIEGEVSLSLDELIAEAWSLAQSAVSAHVTDEKAQKKLAKKTDGLTVASLRSFIDDRVKSYYAEQGFSPQAIESVQRKNLPDLLDVNQRIHAVREFATTDAAQALAAAHKRAGNILSKSDATDFAAINTDLLQEPAEQALFAVLSDVQPKLDAAVQSRDYMAALTLLATMRDSVDGFFDGVMVNAEDEALKANRLGLVHQLYGALDRIMAIEALVL